MNKASFDRRCLPASAGRPQARHLLVAALIGVGALSATAAELGADVHGLLDHARAQNPELALMRAEAEAASQRVQPAGALPDPLLRVELMNVNNYGNDAGFNLLPNKVGKRSTPSCRCCHGPAS